MEVTVNLLRSHAVFVGIAITTWCVGFLILIPVVTYLDNHEDLKKPVSMFIIASLTISAFVVYFIILNRLLNVSLKPFLFYALTPIVTVSILIYWFIKNLRFGW
jgi:hypothetical protein